MFHFRYLTLAFLCDYFNWNQLLNSNECDKEPYWTHEICYFLFSYQNKKLLKLGYNIFYYKSIYFPSNILQNSSKYITAVSGCFAQCAKSLRPFCTLCTWGQMGGWSCCGSFCPHGGCLGIKLFMYAIL